MCLRIFSKEKKPFYTIKTNSSKRLKIVIFPKGLVHGLGQILAIFPSFYFRKNRPGKFLLRYSKTKNAFLSYKKKKFKKVEKLRFFQRG